MSYSVDCEVLGKPATIHVDTIEELRDLIGYGNVVKTRATATRRRIPRLRMQGEKTPTRSNKATSSRAKAKGKAKAARGSRGWGKDVYDRAAAKGIGVLAARSEIAKEKKAKTKKSAA